MTVGDCLSLYEQYGYTFVFGDGKLKDILLEV